MEKRGSQAAWEHFSESHPRSKKLFQLSAEVMPGGLSHNNRKTYPFPLYVDRANGPLKWDIDGEEYVDYNLASASIILGHSHPPVIEAIEEQLQKGTGATACHELELEWARLVTEMVPCADMVRFCGTGTEATMLAMRIARAFTGRSRIVRFATHYHGWNDYAMIGNHAAIAESASSGVPNVIPSTMVVLATDTPSDTLHDVLAEQKDIAAVIVEPSGPRWGAVPMPDQFLHALRKATSELNIPLIFDEVITGFRYAPGGAQERYGITPDLACFAKILAGGLPGAAVTGSAEIMSCLSPWDLPRDDPYVFHYGTFNGNPISAAAGVATLKELANGDAQRMADAFAKDLRCSLSALLHEMSVPGFVYGEASTFHIHLSPSGQVPATDPSGLAPEDFLSISEEVIWGLQCELRLRGVDLFTYNGGVTSAVHGSRELDVTLQAFKEALSALVEKRIIAAA